MGSLLFDVVNFSENHSSLIVIPFIFVFGWDLVLVVKSAKISSPLHVSVAGSPWNFADVTNFKINKIFSFFIYGFFLSSCESSNVHISSFYRKSFRHFGLDQLICAKKMAPKCSTLMLGGFSD